MTLSRPLLLLLPLLGLCALEDPTAKLQGIATAAKAKSAAVLVEFFEKADVSPIPVPDLGPDPRGSERARVQQIEAANEGLAQAAMFKARLATDRAGFVESLGQLPMVRSGDGVERLSLVAYVLEASKLRAPATAKAGR